jgi:ketosteroid isomerase-like protein
MSSNQQLLQNLYGAFNNRELETIISVMSPDVKWANGVEGGFVYGRDAVREYWTNQYKVIQVQLETLKFETDENNRNVVTVHQIVKDLQGNLLADMTVKQIFTIENGAIVLYEIGGTETIQETIQQSWGFANEKTKAANSWTELTLCLRAGCRQLQRRCFGDRSSGDRFSRWKSAHFHSYLIEVALPPAVADLPAVQPSSISFTTTFMLDKSTPEVELLRAGYTAFNARDADATLATMTPDVTLPNGMEGGYIHGYQAVRAYWKRQWSVIHPHDEPISALHN